MPQEELLFNRPKICIFVNVDWFILSHFTDYLIKIIAQNYDVTVLTLNTGKCGELELMGVRVINIDLHRGYSNILFELKTLVRIFISLRKISPDVLELITIKPVIYGGLVAKLLKIDQTVFYMSGLGTLFTFDTIFGFFKSKVVVLLYKFIMSSNSVKIIVENDDDRSIFETVVRLKSEKIHFIPGVGVDLNVFSPHPSDRTTNLRVALASRLLYDKGVVEFVSAAQVCKAKFPDVEFLLVGEIDKTNPSSLADRDVKKLCENGIVEATGNQTDMASLLKTLDIFVLPSYREGFPKVIMEAAATGLPVVTTDVTGCRSAVIQNRTGIIVAPKNPEALAIAIMKLLTSRSIRVELGGNARLHAEKEFDVHLLSLDHIKVWNRQLIECQKVIV